MSPAEDAEAVGIGAEFGLADDGAVRSFLAVFVGGRLDKLWACS